MYADCSETLAIAVMVTTVDTSIPRGTKLNLLARNSLRNHASTSKTAKSVRMVTTADSLMILMPQMSLQPMALLAMTVAVVVAVEEEGAAVVDEDAVEGADGVAARQEDRPPSVLQLPPLHPVRRLLVVLPRRRMIRRSKSLEVVAADAIEPRRKAMPVHPKRRNRTRRSRRSLLRLMRPRNLTRTAKSCAAISETEANATLGISAIFRMRRDLPLVTPNHEDDDVGVLVQAVLNPRRLGSATISVKTSLANMVMSASSNTARMTNARSCNLVLNGRLLGSATSSVMEENANSETSAASLMTRPMAMLRRTVMMQAMRRRRNNSHK
jgi:hypothetical protein